MSWDDQQLLAQQYANQDNLAVRIRTHALYTEPRVDFAAWVLDHAAWRPGLRVVDVGCGSGMYADGVTARGGRYVAGDLSTGMLRALPATCPERVALDVQALPLGRDSADILLANHMLYHVPDRDRAAAELARVLRPDGTLLAATNSRDTTAELDRLLQAVAGVCGLDIAGAPPLPFTLENGADLLARHFGRVTRHDLPARWVFPAARPVVEYVATLREKVADSAENAAWQQFLSALNVAVSDHIARHGTLVINKLTGVFVCADPSDRPRAA